MLSLYWWTKQTSSCFNGVYSPSRKATNDQFIMPIIICCYNQLYRGKAQDVLRVYNMDLIYSLGFPDEMVLVVNQKNDGFGFRYRSKKKNSGQKEQFWELLRQEGNWHSHRTNWVRQNNMRLGGIRLQSPQTMQIVTTTMKWKDTCSLEEKLWPT